MNKFWDWFAEVHQQTVLWWQLGLAICVFEAFSSFLKVGLASAMVFTFAKSLLVMFVIIPLFLGTIVYFVKRK